MRSKPLVLLIAATATLGVLTACGPKDDPAAAPSAVAGSSAAASPTSAGMSVAAACAAVDTAYTELDAQAKAIVVQGMTAEMKGDSAGAKAALAKLQPIFTRVAATFTDAASKVDDAEVQAAITQLADAAKKESTYKTFDDFNEIEQMTGPAEGVLKAKCNAAGAPLQNIS
ncbi:hypothetical protein [Hamadaea tsunoensis]|uniref:hypothetical protein n=1 Tax=Hamadaea tsunoensis TaxID=53368 RepID=UPI00042895CF|nr:hypothetical protein [Hamadaea tsunoensis]